MERDYGFDNIKCILIFSVVLGHLLEFCGDFTILYRMIYLFHMPVFVFISGYFAKSGARPILEKVWFYGLFQILYIAFERLVRNVQTPFQFYTPYWILWYMFVMIFYTVLIPLYRTKSNKKCIAMLMVSVALSLVAGFCKPLGYPLSLSRFFVFQPYFLLGLYAREMQIPSFQKKTKVAFAVGSALSLGIAFMPQITSRLLYGSGYYQTYTDVFFRLLLFLVACLFIGMFWGLKDKMKKEICLVSTVGKHTLSVYLLHGFFMRLGAYHIVPVPQKLWLILIIAVIFCIALGNRFIANITEYLSPVRFVKKK